MIGPPGHRSMIPNGAATVTQVTSFVLLVAERSLLPKQWQRLPNRGSVSAFSMTKSGQSAPQSAIPNSPFTEMRCDSTNVIGHLQFVLLTMEKLQIIPATPVNWPRNNINEDLIYTAMLKSRKEWRKAKKHPCKFPKIWRSGIGVVAW